MAGRGWMLGSVFAAVVGVAVGAFVLSHHKPPPKPPPPTLVETKRVAPLTVPERIESPGTVLATASVSVLPQTSGVLTSVLVHDGEKVRKGQLLFTIDPRPLADAVRQAQGFLERDQALVADAADTERRYKVLLAQDSIATKTYETALNSLNALRAAVVSDRAQLGSAQESLRYTTIRAPVSGRAGAVLLKQGNLATTGSTNALLVINTPAPIDVSFSLPQAQVDAVRRAMATTGRAELPVSVLDAVTSKEVDRGLVAFQDNAYDQTTGTLAFRGRFANTAEALSPGQFVLVRVQLSPGEGVLAVPETALQQGQKGSYVYCIVGGKAVVKNLTVARLVDGQAVVSQGLQAGDEVILTVPNDLREGSAVQSSNEPAPASAPPNAQTGAAKPPPK